MLQPSCEAAVKSRFPSPTLPFAEIYATDDLACPYLQHICLCLFYKEAWTIFNHNKIITNTYKYNPWKILHAKLLKIEHLKLDKTEI